MTSATLRSRPGGFSSASARLSPVERLRRVIQYRRILQLMVRRDLKVRYAGSSLGYVWTVLDPLLTAAVYWFLFTKIFHRTAGPQFSPYMLYLVTGQLPWFWFTSAISAGARSLRSEAQMVRSTNVPRELWIIRSILSKGVEYFFGLPVLALFALAYMKEPSWKVVFLPIAWVVEFAILLGLGLILAPLTVLLRDLDRVIPIVLRLLYFCSPVLYSVTRLPKSYQFIYSFNPTVGFLEVSHATFFPEAMRWSYVWHSAIWAVIFLAIGFFVFTRLERTVLKEI
jgi:ABC-2 type transport system permease protein